MMFRELEASTLSSVSLSKRGKTCFGTDPLFCRFQRSNVFLQLCFNGLKYATSSGWQRCVALGGRNANRILFSKQHFITFYDRWDATLSPMITLGNPFSSFLKYDNAIEKNQSSNIGLSNQPENIYRIRNKQHSTILFHRPDLERLYLVPLGPPSVHVVYKCTEA